VSCGGFGGHCRENWMLTLAPWHGKTVGSDSNELTLRGKVFAPPRPICSHTHIGLKVDVVE
jgi:hypothetical protein